MINRKCEEREKDLRWQEERRVSILTATPLKKRGIFAVFGSPMKCEEHSKNPNILFSTRKKLLQNEKGFIDVKDVNVNK